MLNWGAYELAVAIFEIVRHLRQIRDELHRHNMREDRKLVVKAETGTQTPST